MSDGDKIFRVHAYGLAMTTHTVTRPTPRLAVLATIFDAMSRFQQLHDVTDGQFNYVEHLDSFVVDEMAADDLQDVTKSVTYYSAESDTYVFAEAFLRLAKLQPEPDALLASLISRAETIVSRSI